MMINLPKHICITRPQWVKYMYFIIHCLNVFSCMHIFNDVICWNQYQSLINNVVNQMQMAVDYIYLVFIMSMCRYVYVDCVLSMWGKIMIPMYKLWLHGLYGLHEPRSSHTYSVAQLQLCQKTMFLNVATRERGQICERLNRNVQDDVYKSPGPNKSRTISSYIEVNNDVFVWTNHEKKFPTRNISSLVNYIEFTTTFVCLDLNTEMASWYSVVRHLGIHGSTQAKMKCQFSLNSHLVLT